MKTKAKNIGQAWVNIQLSRGRKVRTHSKSTPHTVRREYFGKVRPVVENNTIYTNTKPKTKSNDK